MALSLTGAGSGYLEIADSSSLDLLDASGWTLFALFYPDSSLTVNQFAYIYSHGVPLVSAYAVNLMALNTLKARILLDDTLSTMIDLSSSNNFNLDAWNAVAITYATGGTVNITLNGITTGGLSFANNVTPAGVARIGHSVQGGARQFNGRLCHIAKWNRPVDLSLVQKVTSTAAVSPQFALQDEGWHIEMFNEDFSFDLQGNLTTTPTLVDFGDHAPVAYPSTSSISFDDDSAVSPEQSKRIIYVGA